MTEKELQKLHDSWQDSERRANIAFKNLEMSRRTFEQLGRERAEKMNLYIQAKLEMMKNT